MSTLSQIELRIAEIKESIRMQADARYEARKLDNQPALQRARKEIASLELELQELEDDRIRAAEEDAGDAAQEIRSHVREAVADIKAANAAEHLAATKAEAVLLLAATAVAEWADSRRTVNAGHGAILQHLPIPLEEKQRFADTIGHTPGAVPYSIALSLHRIAEAANLAELWNFVSFERSFGYIQTPQIKLADAVTQRREGVEYQLDVQVERHG